MKKYATLILSLLVMAIFACKKDKGNYEYTDVNQVKITTDLTNADRNMVITNDSLVISQGGELKVNVILDQNMPVQNLGFKWLLMQTSTALANPQQYILDSTQNLKAKITVVPNLYKLVLKVTDKNTGISFYKNYKLTVATSPWGGEGWVVLQEQATGSDLSVIATRESSTHASVYHNVYALANNNQKLPKGCTYLNIVNYGVVPQSVVVSYLNGAVGLHTNDFTLVSGNSDWFMVQPSSFNMLSNGVLNQIEYIMNGDQIYTRKLNQNTVLTGTTLIGPPILGSWSLSPYVCSPNSISDYYYTLYDKQNKCFFVLKADDNTLVPATQPDVPNKHFPAYSGAPAALHPTTGSGIDLNNIGKNLVYAENNQPIPQNGSTGHNFIFRNNAKDSTWVFQIPVTQFYTNNIATGRFYLKPSNVPGINEASQFASPTFLATPGKFYYVSNQNIYVCTVASLATSTATIGYSFSAGTIIKKMKVFKSSYAANPPASESKVLVVATDETASGNGNNVYFFDINAAGDLVYRDVYKGFDKIIDVSFKKPSQR